jgi:hypothetical protein
MRNPSPEKELIGTDCPGVGFSYVRDTGWLLSYTVQVCFSALLDAFCLLAIKSDVASIRPCGHRNMVHDPLRAPSTLTMLPKDGTVRSALSEDNVPLHGSEAPFTQFGSPFRDMFDDCYDSVKVGKNSVTSCSQQHCPIGGSMLLHT